VSATDHPSRLAGLGLATLLAFTCPSTGSQTAPAAPVVTEADVAKAAKQQPVITEKDMEAAARKHRMPADAELARVPIQGTLRIDALPQPATRRPVDLGAIAKGYEAMTSPGSTGALASGPALLVFVSFSMPEPALSRLVDQAARAGATMVLRGFVGGSLQQTVQRTQQLIGQRQVGFQIDPQAFDRFSVTATPTFVLLRAGAVPAPCAAGTCFPASGYVSTVGDVSVDYALEFIKRGAPGFKQEADSFLLKMKGGRR
jgi:conjugal transfer pilus assembly protein TrbC